MLPARPTAVPKDVGLAVVTETRLIDICIERSMWNEELPNVPK
jgi:hypothetical protein